MRYAKRLALDETDNSLLFFIDRFGRIAISVYTRICDTVDGDSLGRAVGPWGAGSVASPVGPYRKNVALYAYGGDSVGGQPFYDTPRIRFCRAEKSHRGE